MKPSSEMSAGRGIPDFTKEELLEQVGGTDGDWQDSIEGDEGGGGSYGRPREQGEDDKPV